MKLNTVFLLATLPFLSTTFGQLIKSNEYNFEDLKEADPQAYWMWRSEAEQLQTLRIDQDSHKTITLTLCARAQTPLLPIEAQIENVRYSNDGDADTVTFSINSVQLASFNTSPAWAWGHLWNVFTDTGTIGRRFRLVPGEYKLKIQAATDHYGVELDQISIRTRNQVPGDNLICGATFGGN